MRYYFLLFIILTNVHRLQAQPCNRVLQGTLHCHDKYCNNLAGVEILIIETQQGTFTDDKGQFEIKGLCNGTYTLHIHGLGFKVIDTSIHIQSDLNLIIELSATSHTLKSVIVSATKDSRSFMSTVAQSQLNANQLQSLRGRSLAEALQSISGMSVLNSGANIAKPVLHGMHSNRLLMLNDGARLEGQNWGSEHAPEIDASLAGMIKVVKGAATLRYGPEAMSGVIEVESLAFDTSEKVSGLINTSINSNGRGGHISGMLDFQQKLKKAHSGFRIQAGGNRFGTRQAPDYVLANTSEALWHAGIQHQLWFGKWKTDLQYNLYHSKPGLLAYSHVGNLNDLNEVLQQSEPSIKYPFTYHINRPYQQVTHQTFQGKWYYHFNEANTLLLHYIHQSNNRKEYDANPPFNDSLVKNKVADLNFLLITDAINLRWNFRANEYRHYEAGIQTSTQGQGFSGTGHRSLVPNFRSYDAGAYALSKWIRGIFTIEAGIRYDIKQLTVFTRNTKTLTIETRQYAFQQSSYNIGAVMQPSPHWTLSTNMGKAWRAPQVIELFARGIHQGAASYELGDTSLVAESSINSSVNAAYRSKFLLAELTLYSNYINNYIYLKPMLYAVQLIQGAFPVFQYHQTNMRFSGADMDITLNWNKHISSTHQYTFLYARDVLNHAFIPGIAPNRMHHSLTCTIHETEAKQFRLLIGGETVFEQRNVEPDSDFLPPPKTYTLFGVKLQWSINTKTDNNWFLQMGSNNVMNTSYRSYMNRFRYFADEPGRNIFILIQYKF